MTEWMNFKRIAHKKMEARESGIYLFRCSSGHLYYRNRCDDAHRSERVYGNGQPENRSHAD